MLFFDDNIWGDKTGEVRTIERSKELWECAHAFPDRRLVALSLMS